MPDQSRCFKECDASTLFVGSLQITFASIACAGEFRDFCAEFDETDDLFVTPCAGSLRRFPRRVRFKIGPLDVGSQTPRVYVAPQRCQ